MKCVAHAKSTGSPCRRAAIAGATVCRVHGGAAPQVRRKAEERLRSLIDPAIRALKEIVENKEHPQRLAAAREILERDGRIGVVVEETGGGTTFVLQVMPAGHDQRPAVEIQPELEPGNVRAVVRRL